MGCISFFRALNSVFNLKQNSFQKADSCPQSIECVPIGWLFDNLLQKWLSNVELNFYPKKIKSSIEPLDSHFVTNIPEGNTDFKNAFRNNPGFSST